MLRRVFQLMQSLSFFWKFFCHSAYVAAIVKRMPVTSNVDGVQKYVLQDVGYRGNVFLSNISCVLPIHLRGNSQALHLYSQLMNLELIFYFRL